MWRLLRRSFVKDQMPTALPADNHAGRLRRIAPCGARAESRWLAARKHDAALVEIPEQPDRAGPSGREAAHCCNARLQGIQECGDHDRWHRATAAHPEGTVRTETF